MKHWLKKEFLCNRTWYWMKLAEVISSNTRLHMIYWNVMCSNLLAIFIPLFLHRVQSNRHNTQRYYRSGALWKQYRVADGGQCSSTDRWVHMIRLSPTKFILEELVDSGLGCCEWSRKTSTTSDLMWSVQLELLHAIDNAPSKVLAGNWSQVQFIN